MIAARDDLIARKWLALVRESPVTVGQRLLKYVQLSIWRTARELDQNSPQLSLLEIRNSENKFEIQKSKFEIRNSEIKIQIRNSKTFNVEFNFQFRISIFTVKLTLNLKFEIGKINSKFKFEIPKTFNVEFIFQNF